jgi:hypothetical protein
VGQRRGEKKNTSGREDVHPQNRLNGLILNWCIGGCWFTPTLRDKLTRSRHAQLHLGGPYSCKAHPLGLYPTRTTLGNANDQDHLNLANRFWMI